MGKNLLGFGLTPKCMIATARIKAGMPNRESGKPLKSYTNQSESINNKLTRQKEDMAKNDKNKVDMSKVQFTKTCVGGG